jgi:hypothetical protein
MLEKHIKWTETNDWNCNYILRIDNIKELNGENINGRKWWLYPTCSIRSYVENVSSRLDIGWIKMDILWWWGVRITCVDRKLYNN